MEEIDQIDPVLEMLQNNKREGFAYRERRHQQWLENYTLARDNIITNRLTQRQTVNLPLMKTGIKSLLKDVDDRPVIFFENLDNDKQAEVFENEYWKLIGDQDHNKFDLQDIVDKKQVFHFGRSFDQWQIVDGQIKMTVQDPMDILVDRYCDPTDLNTSRYLIHNHIFMTLAQVKADPMYDKSAIAKLEEFYKSKEGIIKVATSQQMLIAKNEKMSQMGVADVEDPVLGETLVEMSLHFVFQEIEGMEHQIWLYVEAEDNVILMKRPLEDILGKTKDSWWKNHYNYNSWADDVERQDFWSDGIADIIRGPNKVLNAWYSQLVENRTLRNLNMNLFDSSIEGWKPQTWNPKAWGMYGVPRPANGKISDIFQQMPVADLTDSLDEMKFVLEMSQRGSGASATQQGEQTERQITLGEVQLALGEAKERIKGMSKFYTPVWQQRGMMFSKLIEANPDKLDAVKIYKEGRNTKKIFVREIAPKDWMTKTGSRVKVWSQDEKENQDTEAIQKLSATKQLMPFNKKLDEVFKRRMLEYVGLAPEELNAIMEEEEEIQQSIQDSGVLQNNDGGQAGGSMQPNPVNPNEQSRPTA
jgi:hypothetical protein